MSDLESFLAQRKLSEQDLTPSQGAGRELPGSLL